MSPSSSVGFLLIVISFTGCARYDKKEIQLLHSLSVGLDNASQSIDRSTLYLYQSMENRTKDPQYAQRAMEWYPKAVKVKEASVKLLAFIDSVTQELKQTAGYEFTGDGSYRKEDMNASTKVLITEGKGERLYQLLMDYNNTITSVDNGMALQLSNALTANSKDLIVSPGKADSFVQAYFNQVPVVNAVAILSRFKNNVKLTENIIAEYCHNMIPTTGGCGYTAGPKCIVSQSSSYVKAGDKIEIKAGVGNFSRITRPVITISGKNIAVDNDAVANYSFKAAQQPGKHSLPVKIDYYLPDGLQESMETVIEYTVAASAPCE